MSLTLLDQSHVLAATRRLAKERGLDDRAAYIEGDMFETDLGGPYDLIIASNVLHLSGDEQCRQLLRRLKSALAPHGRLAIHELAPDATNPDPVSQLFSLVVLVRTHHGETHTLADYQQLFAEAEPSAVPRFTRSRDKPTTLLLSTHN